MILFSFIFSLIKKWRAKKRERCRKKRAEGIVAVCLPSAGNELVKEKSKWFIGRKGGNRKREDSEKERKRLDVIGESLCLFPLFIFYYISPVFSPPPICKALHRPPPHRHDHICQLLLSLLYTHCVKLHWLFRSLFLSCFCSLTLSWSTSVTSLYASLSSACHLRLCPSFYGSKLHSFLALCRHTSFGTRAKNANG